MGDLKQEILKTLAFYDIFQYPLTPLETNKNLGVAAKFADVTRALDELKNENKILKKDGYFFLPQDNDLAAKRKARFLISFKKFERAKKITRLFAWFPFIKFIGVCNSLGYFNATEESDIDFFIIAEKKHVWTARFFSIAILKIFNLRPTAQTNKDKFCLSFFISDEKLNISHISFPGGDPYFWHWMNWIVPLYDDKVYERFIEANNWIKNIIPNFIPQNNYFDPRKRFIKKIFEFCFRGAEIFLKNIQLKTMPVILKEAANRGDGSVVINDDMLKFHLLDRRAEYREKYNKAVSSITY